MKTVLAVLLLIVALPLVGCMTPQSGANSPSNPASSTAAGGFGAQTNTGTQGQAQTPQTTSAGPATQNWVFASKGDPTVQLELLKALSTLKATPEQIVDAMRALNGAPQTVSINTRDNITSSGDPEATGASGGTGGGGTTGNVSRP